MGSCVYPGKMSKLTAPVDELDIPAHLDVLRRYALVLTRDPLEAEDLVQEALLRAVAGAASWRPGRPVRPWLLAIVHNQHVSRRRRCRVEAAHAAELERSLPSAIPPAQPHRVQLGRTMQALLRLPEEQREVLTLVALEGLAYKDAAALLDIPLGTLMSRLGRARAALRSAVGEDSAGEAAPGEIAAGEAGADRRAAPVLRVVR